MPYLSSNNIVPRNINFEISPGLNFFIYKTGIINSKELFKVLNQTTQVMDLAIFNANITLKIMVNN